MSFVSTGLNYTKEEIEINGNQVPLGKLHDEVCDYMESEWKATESEILNISTALWKALEVLNNELIKKDERIKELEKNIYKLEVANGFHFDEMVINENKYQEAVETIDMITREVLSKSPFLYLQTLFGRVRSKYGLDKQGEKCVNEVKNETK